MNEKQPKETAVKIQPHRSRYRTKSFIVKLSAAICLFLAIIAVCIYTLFIRPDQKQESYVYKELSVKRGTLMQGITESGNVNLETSSVVFELEINDIDDSESSDSSEEDSGEADKYLKLENVFVVPGQRVEAGDPLFQFTQESINSVRRKLEKKKSEASLTLQSEESEYAAQLQTAMGTYNNTRAGSDTAARTYTAENNRLSQEIDLLYGDIQALEGEINAWNLLLTDEDTLEEYSDLKYAFEKAQKLLDEAGTSSAAAYTANYSAWQSAKTAFETLDDTLKSYREGIVANQETILNKLNEISEASANLSGEQLDTKHTYDSCVLNGNLASAIYQYTKESLLESVNAASEAVAEAQELLNEFELFIGEDGIVYASEAGLVTDVGYEAGDQLKTTGSMMTYAAYASYTIEVDVSEEDIAGIHVGDRVTIEMDAYSDEVYEGCVSAITTSADSSHSATVNYPVSIRIEGDTSALYGGMTASVTFVSEELPDVLYVSARAVIQREDGTYVYTKNADEEMVLKKVNIGFTNGSEVQILEEEDTGQDTISLSEGDTVYIRSQVSTGQSENAWKE